MFEMTLDEMIDENTPEENKTILDNMSERDWLQFKCDNMNRVFDNGEFVVKEMEGNLYIVWKEKEV